MLITNAAYMYSLCTIHAVGWLYIKINLLLLHIISWAKYYAVAASVRAAEIVFCATVHYEAQSIWGALWEGAPCGVNVEQVSQPSQYMKGYRLNCRIMLLPLSYVAPKSKIDTYTILFTWKYHTTYNVSFFSTKQNYASILLLTLLHIYSLCAEKNIIFTIFYIHAYA